MHWALTSMGASSMARPASFPRIFRVSVSSLSSSPEMKGTTLSRIAIEETPGIPAPEIA